MRQGSACAMREPTQHLEPRQFVRDSPTITLTEVRLSPDQSNGGFVVILAEDGKIRAITHVAREAVDDRFQLRGASQKQRVELVERNLVAISEIIKRKYAARETAPHTDRIGMTNPITTADLAGIGTA
jgi:hypothetical protein